MGQRLFPEGWAGQLDMQMMSALTIALLCATAPLELSQLAFALAGAAVYALVSSLRLAPLAPPPGRPVPKASKATSADFSTPGKPRAYSACRSPAAHCGRRTTSAGPLAAPAPGSAAALPGTPSPVGLLGKQELRLPATQLAGAMLAPSFAAARWDEQVEELLGHIAPSVGSERIVQQLARLVKQALRRTMPEAEVSGFASGDLVRAAAVGLAMPEVDLVVTATPQVLALRLQGRLAPRGTCSAPLDARKLQKSAIRWCTDRLVSTGGFKFRRSAFRGQEPKVTLLAPASLGICYEAIPVGFSVNSTTPLYNAALVEECGRREPRATALALLVKRWAKDRGVCHAAKGHLSPYAWSLLTVYFLQVGLAEGPLLPPLVGCAMPCGLSVPPVSAEEVGEATPCVPMTSPKSAWTPAENSTKKSKSVGALFKEFVRFYSKTFQWHSEGVSVRTGERSQPDLGPPPHVVLHEDGVTTEVGPSIEDPFEPKRNLGDCTTAASLARMHQELKRAEDLCDAGASLTELLEPWVPPERGASHRLREEEEDEPEEASRAAAVAGGGGAGPQGAARTAAVAAPRRRCSAAA